MSYGVSWSSSAKGSLARSRLLVSFVAAPWIAKFTKGGAGKQFKSISVGLKHCGASSLAISLRLCQDEDGIIIRNAQPTITRRGRGEINCREPAHCKGRLAGLS